MYSQIILPGLEIHLTILLLTITSEIPVAAVLRSIAGANQLVSFGSPTTLVDER
jgi:hypothetical protein